MLSSLSDPFFASQCFANYGDTGKALKALVADFVPEQRRATDISSIGAPSAHIRACLCDVLCGVCAFLSRYPYPTDGGPTANHPRCGLHLVLTLPCMCAPHLRHAEDLQRVVTGYSKFQEKNNIVRKHVALFSELNRNVAERSACSL